jgi:hypothetical protein
MVGGAGGVVVHSAVLASGDVLQTIVGEGPEAGRLLQQDGGVAKDQPVDGLWLLSEDGDGGRGVAGMPRSLQTCGRRRLPCGSPPVPARRRSPPARGIRR